MKNEIKLSEIEKKIEQIKDNVVYSSVDVVKMGVIRNTNNTSSLFVLYRLFKSGKLKSVNMSNGGSARYFVKGKDLKKYVIERYGLNS